MKSEFYSGAESKGGVQPWKVFAICLALGAFVTLLGCDSVDDDDDDDPPATNTNVVVAAPSTIGGKAITFFVESGEAPFASSGFYTITTSSGAGVAGTYTTSGSGTTNDRPSSGSYAYQKTARLEADVRLADANLTNIFTFLSFQTTNTGRFEHTRNPEPGIQSGTFRID